MLHDFRAHYEDILFTIKKINDFIRVDNIGVLSVQLLKIFSAGYIIEL